ncbi:MAG: hypothetical protein Q9219_002158 [cf. Caloplaca sp. 3 TL-2023]
MDSSLRIDEGYSEDVRSQDDPDSPMRLDTMSEGPLSQPWSMVAGIPPQVMALNETERSVLIDRVVTELVYAILRTLRTSSIAEIVDRLRPLLHIDPVTVLPPEITSEIFSYLTPSTLLEASRASRAWRERALDSRLWRLKFRSEGWGLDMDAVRRYEQEYKSRRKDRSRPAEASVEQSRQKKRARADGRHPVDGDASPGVDNMTPVQTSKTWNQQQGEVEADDDKILSRQDSGKDEEMYDVETSRVDASSYHTELQLAQVGTMSARKAEKSVLRSDHEHPKHEEDVSPRLDEKQSLVRYDTSGAPQINYNYVYKQKRKLEENWESGSYQSFQLPHRDHPEEAHRECVYTIQYSGKHLVSGSRDKTLRKWDLDTQRLIGKPLVGHNASVLCLQFDDSESEDMIASGSSDTDVILWQFSTGKMIKKIPRAHDESVLNLKFDARFLVTCSKDKTIKIWNRHELRPGDPDYPVKGVEGGGTCPAYILDLREMETGIDLDRQLTAEEKAPLAPYTPIMVLESHNAAVNAIHIHEDQLVSASGDRHVHLWNIHTGVRTSVCRGHTKGIACVQYDGKRVVSGSSDNTIRIFDPITQAEVACLKGHTRLVRTIQSAFGDLPGKREQLEAEAMEVDGKFHEARRAGKIPAYVPRNRERNAGSRDPRDMMAVGAKLPPGGGGSRWGRIVSGSYDETIIIWKKMSDGRWVKAHVLRQEEALRAAGGPLLSQSDLNNQAHQQALATARNYAPLPPPNGQHPQNPQTNMDNDSVTQYRAFASQLTQLGHQPQAGPSRTNLHNVTNPAHPFPHHTSAYNLPHQQSYQQPPPQQQQQQQQHQHQQQHSVNPSVQQIAAAVTHGGPDTIQHPTLAQVSFLHHHQQQNIANAIASAQNAAQNLHPPPIFSPTNPPPPPPLPPTANATPHNNNPTTTTTTTTNNQNTSTSNHPPQTPPIIQHQPHHPYQQHPHPHPHPQQQQQQQQHHRIPPQQAQQISQPNARVFKLQFDARRIICCSQDPKIVGWDFANGDEGIVGCSRFFATPQ